MLAILAVLILPVTITLLWLQLYWSLIPTWRDGEYYAYGWFVPPLALAFAWRRWQTAKELKISIPTQSPKPLTWPLGAFFVLGVMAILPLRIIGDTDPGWRPPILLHAAIVFCITHLALWKLGNQKLSLYLIPASIFALTAVPLPWLMEQGLVRRLTTTVINLTRETFLLMGKPVEAMGDRLTMGGQVVEVTDGCSGIRSLQSLAMAGLFFGELLLLSWTRRIVLLILAGICAVTVNTGRAWWLAEVSFSQGKVAADAAHDTIGHIAFLISAGGLFLAAWLMQRRKPQGRVVVRRVSQAG